MQAQMVQHMTNNKDAEMNEEDKKNVSELFMAPVSKVKKEFHDFLK